MSADERRQELAAVALAALMICAAQITGFHVVRLDDAYITYRYGQNLASGNGFVFNPNDRLLGTTAPGLGIVAGLVYAIAGRGFTPDVMSALGCVGWTAQAVFLYALLRDGLGRYGAAFVALAVAAGAAGSQLWVPLETNVVAAMTLGALLLAFRARWIAAGALVGIAAVFRGDAWLVGAAVTALAAHQGGRRAAWRAPLAMAAAHLPWVLFSLAYFHRIFPTTLGAKAQHFGRLDYARHVLAALPRTLSPWEGGLPVAVLLWALAVAGAALLVRRERRLLALVGYGALHAVAYIGLSPDPKFLWHLYPAEIVFVVCVVAAVATAAARLPVAPRSAAAAALVVGLAYRPIEFSLIHDELFWSGQRDAIYRDVAAYLAERSGPGDWVDAEEVGTLAYWAGPSGLRFIDHADLVTRDSHELHMQIATQHVARSKEERAAVCSHLMLPGCLRWLVMNHIEVKSHAFLYKPRETVYVHRGAWRLWLVDLTEPASAP